MAKAQKMIDDECAEILVQFSTGTESAALGRRAPEVKGTTKDEHSYAYSLRKQAFEGKEKDHCYSYKDTETLNTRSENACMPKDHSYSLYRRWYTEPRYSMSDENISQNCDDHYGYILPHYQSSDSALDVTGFDSISEKCLSSENLNVKTVDVFTDRCILPGKSDPDISKMTLQPCTDFMKPSSLPSSFENEVDGKGMIMDHSYSSFAKLLRDKGSSPSTSNWSPLQDHSYNLSVRGQLLVSGGLKRGRSIETVDHIKHNVPENMSVSKSPFLDHTYQSVELKKSSLKKKNKSLLMMKYDNSSKTVEADRGTESASRCSAVQKQDKFKSRPPLYDHTYDKTETVTGILSSSRFRSNSLSDVGEHSGKSVQDGNRKSSTSTTGFYDAVKAEKEQVRAPFFDHTYDRTDEPMAGFMSSVKLRSNSLYGVESDFQQRSCNAFEHVRMEDDSDNSTDSGTESLNDENCVDMPMIEDVKRESLRKDHSYVYKSNTM